MLIYKGFIGQIDYDIKSNQIVGEVVNASDLLEFSGANAQEVSENFRRIVDEYYAMQKELSGQRPTPVTGNFTVCLTTEKQRRVISAARKNGQSVIGWLNHTIDSQLENYFKKQA